MNFFKKIVTFPVRKTKQVMTEKIVGLLLRHALTALGAAGLFTDGEVAQLAGAVAVIVGLAWSGWEKYRQTPKA